MRRRRLVIFARSPRLGAVKSRLAKDIGVVAAWTFYRRTLGTVLRRLGRGPSWRAMVAISPDGARLAGRCSRLPVLPQGPGGLGARMGRVFASLPPGPVVIVGSDIPALKARHVAAAFRALGRGQAVFGPARDGGYWLVGLRRAPGEGRLARGLFGGVRWSTGHALADTLANLSPGAAEMLETLSDVDTAADL